MVFCLRYWAFAGGGGNATFTESLVPSLSVGFAQVTVPPGTLADAPLPDSVIVKLCLSLGAMRESCHTAISRPVVESRRTPW